jgi:hypothetical protein
MVQYATSSTLVLQAALLSESEVQHGEISAKISLDLTLQSSPDGLNASCRLEQTK